MKPSVRLKLWQSIALVILVGVAPMVGITLGVITISINKDIDFGRAETNGLVFQRPLERILDALPRYQAASDSAESEALRQELD